LKEVVLTDTVPLPPAKRLPKIHRLTVAPLFGEAIRRIHRGESVGALFSSEVSFTQQMLMWDEDDSNAELPFPTTEDEQVAVASGPARER
jgi:hypothetical protein